MTKQHSSFTEKLSSHEVSSELFAFIFVTSFPRVSFSMLHRQALTVTAVIPIAWPDFAKIYLPHPSTTAYLMLCRCAKFVTKRKTWGRSRQKPKMTDFDHEVNKLRQRLIPYVKSLAQTFSS